MVVGAEGVLAIVDQTKLAARLKLCNGYLRVQYIIHSTFLYA